MYISVRENVILGNSKFPRTKLLIYYLYPIIELYLLGWFWQEKIEILC